MLRIITTVVVIFFAGGCAKQGVTVVNDNSMRDVVKRQVVERIYFGTASSEISSRYSETMKSGAGWMSENPGAVLIVEGHCDERGREEYNLALGDRRARAVKAGLVERGVDEKSLIIMSYGEKRPADRRNAPSAWRKNRRVELVVR